MNEDFNNGANQGMESRIEQEVDKGEKDADTRLRPRKPIIKIIVPFLVAAIIFGIWAYKNLLPGGIMGQDDSEFALDATEDFDLERFLSHGLPVMINFRADYCTTCRDMDPIIEKVNKDLRGRAVIKSVDADKNLQAAGKFGVWVIPMQFFFDAEGKPYGYHEGFLPEEDIIRILKEIGMK